MFTHPYIASQLNSQRIAQLHADAAAATVVREARALRRQTRSNRDSRAPRRTWFRLSAVRAHLSSGLS
jgi:hypothetical protein